MSPLRSHLLLIINRSFLKETVELVESSGADYTFNLATHVCKSSDGLDVVTFAYAEDSFEEFTGKLRGFEFSNSLAHPACKLTETQIAFIATKIRPKSFRSSSFMSV